MEQLLKLGARNGKAVILIVILVAVGLVFAHISGLTPEQQQELPLHENLRGAESFQ